MQRFVAADLINSDDQTKGTPMLDFIMLAAGCAGLAVCILYVFVCDRL
jgi:hypothetical protein